MESTQKMFATSSAIAMRGVTLNGRLSARTGVVALAFAGVAAGLLLSWDWLVAAGFSSLVVGVLPCAAMCALGLCMGRGGKESACAAKDVPASSAETRKP